MPIAVRNQNNTTRLAEEEFKDEDELQSCLERSPYLLASEQEPNLVTVQREVILPSAGKLDLLMVDQEGVPVAVEVKLARNTQSRREVVAQAFDYVSDLTQLTYDELDDIIDGALTRAIDDLCQEASAQSVRKQCGTNLRAGTVRVVIAVDRASEDLIRIVRYMNEHSDLDVRLVAVSKFDDGRILVPRMFVAGGSEGQQRTAERHASREVDAYFQSVLDAYNAEAPEELRTRGHGKRYRPVRPDEWPGMLHYEFQNYEDEVGVELHLESDLVAPLSVPLKRLAGHKLPGKLTIEWDPRWSRGRGRLFAKVEKGQPPAVAVQAMQALISETRELVESELEKM
jgi:hypothetical protein